ncbi:restriction endonuclease subunit S [Firmicutes bacterium AF36-3BH]|nr:restriction endonuclease subunit S [Firmicutes bacterium AF36-3BH]
MNTGRTKAPLINFIEVNPRETIDKGHLSKKIGMDKLQPFCRDIQEYEIAEFNGGAKFRNSDTIMARITPCLENGKIAMVNVLDENEVGFGSTEYIVFRAKKGLTIPDFVYYLVSSSIVRNPAIKSMVGSSGRQRVQIDVVKNIEICFPSISEQFKIASILKALDDKIALNNKINNNLEQQAIALYENTFCTPSNIAMKHISLSDLMDYSGGSQPPASKFIFMKRDGYIRFVQIRDYDTDSHITYIPESAKNKLCEEHDIMIARYGASLGRICFGINGAYNVALAKVFPKKSYFREFLRCYLSSRTFYEGINNKGGRSAQAGFNQSDINSFELDFPIDEAIVQKFESTVAPMFEQRLQLRKENQRLASLRDTLLPKLMSGEFDVSDIDI